jgi:hypothetical protein
MDGFVVILDSTEILRVFIVVYCRNASATFRGGPVFFASEKEYVVDRRSLFFDEPLHELFLALLFKGILCFT